MKCIVCDRCGKVITDTRKCRVITCARPFRPENVNKPNYSGVNPQDNEIQWTKELCSECTEALEQFLESSANNTEG